MRLARELSSVSPLPALNIWGPRIIFSHWQFQSPVVQPGDPFGSKASAITWASYLSDSRKLPSANSHAHSYLKNISYLDLYSSKEVLIMQRLE